MVLTSKNNLFSLTFTQYYLLSQSCERPFFIALKTISQISVWLSVRKKRFKKFLIAWDYFTSKRNRQLFCVMNGKNIKTHMFQWKNLFMRVFLLKWMLLKHLWEHIQVAERLTEELQKYPCLYEKGNRGYKNRDRKENAWRVVEQFLMGFLRIIRDQAILWKAVHFSSLATFAKKFVIQKTWNTILYHWHASPAMNYGKLIVLFFI